MTKRIGGAWFLLCSILMYAVTGIGLLLMAWLLSRFQLGSTFVNVGIVVIYILSCWLGGFVAGRIKKNKKFLWGLLLSIVYYLLLLLISWIMKGSMPEDMVHMVTTFMICMASGTLGGMMG